MAAGIGIEKWSTPATSLSSTDFINYVYNRRRTFTVVLESTDDVDIARYADRIPRVGHPHPTNFWLLVTRVTAKQISPILAEVDVEYETTVNPDSNGENNPLNEPPDIRVSFVQSEVDVDNDIKGKPLQTVMREPYRGIKRPKSDLAITISRNVKNLNVDLMRSYIECVNSDSFLDQPKGTAFIFGLGAESQGSKSFRYWKLFSEVHFRRAYPNSTDDKSWWHRELRKGFYVKNGIVDQRIRALDDFGHPMASPVLLKPNGEREDDETATDVWDYFEIFDSKPFATLGLV